MICQNCGNSVGENAKFCVKCGTAVQDQKSADAAMPAKKVNKKEYFATLCSPKARKLMKASWIVWAVNVLSTIYFAAIGNLIKTDRGYKLWELFEFIQSEQNSDLVAFVILAAGWMIGSILLTTIIGGLACRKKSVLLSVVFLITTLFSMLPVKAITLIAAICVLVFNIIVNKEYKKYMKLADAK